MDSVAEHSTATESSQYVGSSTFFIIFLLSVHYRVDIRLHITTDTSQAETFLNQYKEPLQFPLSASRSQLSACVRPKDPSGLTSLQRYNIYFDICNTKDKNFCRKFERICKNTLAGICKHDFKMKIFLTFFEKKAKFIGF